MNTSDDLNHRLPGPALKTPMIRVPVDLIIGINNLCMTEYRLLFKLLKNVQEKNVVLKKGEYTHIDKKSLADMFGAHRIPLSTSLANEAGSFPNKHFRFFQDIHTNIKLTELQAKTTDSGAWVYDVKSFPDGLDILINPVIINLIMGTIDPNLDKTRYVDVNFDNLRRMTNKHSWRVYLALEYILISQQVGYREYLLDSKLSTSITLPLDYLALLGNVMPTVKTGPITPDILIERYVSTTADTLRTQLGLNFVMEKKDGCDNEMELLIENTGLPYQKFTRYPDEIIHSRNAFAVEHYHLLHLMLSRTQFYETKLSYGKTIEIDLNDYRSMFFLPPLSVTHEIRSLKEKIGKPGNLMEVYKSFDDDISPEKVSLKDSFQLLESIEIDDARRTLDEDDADSEKSSRKIYIRFTKQVIDIINKAVTSKKNTFPVDTLVMTGLMNRWGYRITLALSFLEDKIEDKDKAIEIAIPDGLFRVLMGLKPEEYGKIPNLRRLCLDRGVLDIKLNAGLGIDGFSYRQQMENGITHYVFFEKNETIETPLTNT